MARLDAVQMRCKRRAAQILERAKFREALDQARTKWDLDHPDFTLDPRDDIPDPPFPDWREIAYPKSLAGDVGYREWTDDRTALGKARRDWEQLVAEVADSWFRLTASESPDTRRGSPAARL